MTIKNMTEEARAGNRSAAAIVKGVAMKTALLVAVGAAAFLGYAVFLGADRPWRLPLGALFGGFLGLLNFRWLALAVERVYLREGATPGLSQLAAAVISFFKLSLIFVVLFVVIKLRLLHALGLVAGLSFCFLAILWEGLTVMKHNLMKSEQ